MIIAVWIRAAAPGWRAIASTAEATARPWPRPQRPAARAMPSPAAITANGPTQFVPPPAAPWAWASTGVVRTASIASISVRRTNVLLSSEGMGLVVPAVRLGVLGCFDGGGEVSNRGHEEAEDLQQA